MEDGEESLFGQDKYAAFLVQASSYDSAELLEVVEGLANAHDAEVLLQIQQRLESLVQEVKALQGQ